MSSKRIPITYEHCINHICPINPNDWVIFKNLLEYKKVGRLTTLISEGDFSDSVYFVKKGFLVRSYQKEDGREVVKGFTFEGQVVTAYSSIIQKIRSTISIKALEDSEVFLFSYADFCLLREGSHYWEKLSRLMLESYYLERVKRESDLLLLSAAERYESFRRSYHHVCHRIPLNLIASFLSITPESFSRIRKS